MSSLELRSAISRETDGFPANIAFSPSGNYLFSFYQINVDFEIGVTRIAEIFDISKGRFDTLTSLQGSAEFFSADEGNASGDFKLFSILDEQPGFFQIGKLDKRLNIEYKSPAQSSVKIVNYSRCHQLLPITFNSTFCSIRTKYNENYSGGSKHFPAKHNLPSSHLPP